ncbi:sterol carrier family protein [Streptomyces sp. NPDC047017]|uniref:sterol carrier family protein n=1 Tax=Streptomyces sp. NPDC047017 TaxID=3155024 RepID=UPI0033EACABD
MPPAKKRTRTYDPVRTRTAVLAQFGAVRAAVSALTPEQYALPARSGGRSVRELVVRTGAAVTAVGRLLALPEPARPDAVLLDWPSAAAADRAAADDDVTRVLAADPPGLDAWLADAGRDLADQLDRHPGTRLLATAAGALPLADYLVTRAVELVVRTDDLNAAVPGLDIPFDRQALAACTRLLADALAVKAPGGSTEVRVPPYAVVQCVPGPRHTRGTPPNVVETDPLTWVRLATGRTTWRQALADAAVSAGGERADLGELLPLMG